MKEIIVKIPEENVDLASQLLNKLGAEITGKGNSKKSQSNKLVEKKKKTITKKKIKPQKISPTYLFGKWKNLDIDAKKLREEAWDRSHKFL